MHPDRKIGFALGILLVGIVAALFFRNEPLRTGSVPTVRRERELNQQLRDRDVAVYLDDPIASAERDGDTVDGHPVWTLPNLVDKLNERNHILPSPIAGAVAGESHQESERGDDFHRPLPPLSAFARESDVAEKPPGSHQIGAPDHETPIADAEFPQITRQPAPENDRVPPLGEFDEYVVEYGDTLSGLAERFLGSQSRYSDIYEANRDRLPGPDKLRVGKAIRIPRL
jgi:LysM domain